MEYEDNEIPIVDFSSLTCVDGSVLDATNSEVKNIADEIFKAFTTIGFVYIKNHGIPEEKISQLFQVGEKFFKLSSEEKNKYARNAAVSNHGYVGVGVERIDPSKPSDFKEAYNVTEPLNDNFPWPDGHCSDFRSTTTEFIKLCIELSLKILDFIAIGLNLQDKMLMRCTHKLMGTVENASTLRILYYSVMKELVKGQVRLGEHSDYGTITLLFQDNVGGLQVLSKNGEFKAARPIEGTILVNIGDLLQRWSSDKLVSTKHRVVVPHEESSRLISRQSAAFFVHPDNDVIIDCLDGSKKYLPITSLEYLKQRLKATYFK